MLVKFTWQCLWGATVILPSAAQTSSVTASLLLQQLGFYTSVLYARDLLRTTVWKEKTSISPRGLVYYQYRDSGNLGSLDKASDTNAQFLHNGANFTAYLCFTTKNPAVIITRQAARQLLCQPSLPAPPSGRLAFF